MKSTEILETCLCVDDLEAAESFYRDIIGLEFYAKVPGRHCFFRCGQSMFLLFNPDVTQSPPGSPIPGHGTQGAGHVAFKMTEDEIDGWRDHLKYHNIPIESEYEWPGGGFSIYLVTPRTWNLPD